MKKKIRLLLDTDIGDDIDDAMALGYICKSGAFDLVGITTVFRDTVMRARVAKKLLVSAGADGVPVVAGNRNGLDCPYEATELIQFSDDLLCGKYEPDAIGGSAEFIAQMCDRYPGELVLAGIGPFTNLAEAVQKYPESVRKAARIIVMGGTFFEQHLEWNALCDKAATKILFESGLPLECVGFDVTKRVQLCYRQYRYILEQPAGGLCGDLAELLRLWSRQSWRAPILHDPLVFQYLVHPEILSMQRVYAVVETKGEYTAGMTVNLDTFNEASEHLVPAARIRAARFVDEKRALDDFMSTVFSYR